MFDFSELSFGETKHYYIYCISDDAVVHLPFKRNFEKQTGHNCPMTKDCIDDSSYWIEDVVYGLLCRYVRDNGLSFDDYEVRSYTE